MDSTALSRHPTIQAALALARRWCVGRIIDDAPALAHAVKVAAKLREHVPEPDPQLVAAVLLHDGPEFAPPNVDLDAVLAELGPQVRQVVRALEAEHASLGSSGRVPFAPEDRWVWWASAADKIVALSSMLRRAAKSGGPAFWAKRTAFIDALPYLLAFSEAAEPHLPQTMAAELSQLVAVAWQAPPAMVVKGGHGQAARPLLCRSSSLGQLAGLWAG